MKHSGGMVGSLRNKKKLCIKELSKSFIPKGFICFHVFILCEQLLFVLFVFESSVSSNAELTMSLKAKTVILILLWPRLLIRKLKEGC